MDDLRIADFSRQAHFRLRLGFPQLNARNVELAVLLNHCSCSLDLSAHAGSMITINSRVTSVDMALDGKSIYAMNSICLND
jgi:hypothetical protein